MRLTVIFLLLTNLMLFSQNQCSDIPAITIDSLDNLSLNSQTAHFKILKDSNYHAFSFKGGFEFLEIYFDTCEGENKLKLDSNGLVVPNEQMINSGVCYCKSCIERYSKISTEKDVFVKIIKPVKVKIVKHKKTVEKNLLWYEKNLKSGDKIRLNKILFVGGEARFRPVSYKDLNRLYSVLKENPHLHIEIQGHVNSPRKKNSKKNQDLSEARANAVSNYLIRKGIKSNRLTSVGFGNTEMIYPNTTSEYEMQFNRRVEILVK